VNQPDIRTKPRPHRASFTLVELLVALSVAAMLSAMTLTAMWSARQAAAEARTRSIVTKVNELLLMQWSEVESRRLAYVVTPIVATRQRLFYLRQMMRIEFPDRKSDLLAPFAPSQRTARYRGYLRTLAQVYNLPSTTSENAIINRVILQGDLWTPQLQHAECLFLILASTRIDDGNALDYFSDTEVGDTDGDGMREILDAWGNPIFYLRWAPGYVSELGFPEATQTADWTVAPDGFDPLHVDVHWNDTDNLEHFIKPYQLYPLVVSAGRDGAFDIVFDFDNVLDWSSTRGAPVIYSAERSNPADPLTANNPYVMKCRANISNSVPTDSCGMSTGSSIRANYSRIFMIGMPSDTNASHFLGDPESPLIDNFEDNISNQQSQVN
jgi:hypothetical protein